MSEPLSILAHFAEQVAQGEQGVWVTLVKDRDTMPSCWVHLHMEDALKTAANWCRRHERDLPDTDREAVLSYEGKHGVSIFVEFHPIHTTSLDVPWDTASSVV